jgi:mono/diheme cytochrome c family protein
VIRPEIGNSEKLTCWIVAIWLLASSVGLLIAGSTAAADDDIPNVNPMSGDEMAIDEGRSWFRGICSGCHSEGASSRNAPVDLRKFNKGFRQFVLTVKNGKRVPGRLQYMPAWGRVLSEKQIYQIGAYLETLALPEANWKEPLKGR